MVSIKTKNSLKIVLTTPLQQWLKRKKHIRIPKTYKKKDSIKERVSKNKYLSMYVDKTTGVVYALQENDKLAGFCNEKNIDKTITYWKEQGRNLKLIKK